MAKRAARASGGKTQRRRKTDPAAPGGDAAIGPGHNSSKASKLTLNDERALFMQHRGPWNSAQAKLAVAEKLLADVVAALKADGFTKKQFELADDLGKPKSEARVHAEVRDRLKVAYFMGHPMGGQLNLFDQPDRTPVVDRAYDEGKSASMQNKAAQPPNAPDTEAYRAYMAGFHDHQREIAGGIKAPSSFEASKLAHAEPEGSA